MPDAAVERGCLLSARWSIDRLTAHPVAGTIDAYARVHRASDRKRVSAARFVSTVLGSLGKMEKG